MKQYPATPREDARVGLAGPIWGLGAALAAYLVFLATGATYWAALARAGAWLNLFNLLPLGPLDGGRGFRALAQGQRWLVVAVMGGAWFFTGDGLLVLLTLVGAARLFGRSGAAEPDRIALAQFVLLLVSLTALSQLPVRIFP